MILTLFINIRNCLVYFQVQRLFRTLFKVVDSLIVFPTSLISVVWMLRLILSVHFFSSLRYAQLESMAIPCK